MSNLLKRALKAIDEKAERKEARNNPEIQDVLNKLWGLYNTLLKTRGKPLLAMEIDFSRAFADVMKFGFKSSGIKALSVPLSQGKATLTARVIGFGPLLAVRLDTLPVLMLSGDVPALNILVGGGNLLQYPTVREISDYVGLYEDIITALRKPKAQKKTKRKPGRPRKSNKPEHGELRPGKSVG